MSGTLDGVHFLWAKTEAEAIELQDLGWRLADQRATHHHHHAVLMRWHGEGEPKIPPAAKGTS